nr:MAG TPA: tail completion protein [Caudoviricetes sp.]
MKLKPIIEELRNYCPSFEQRVYGIGTFSQLSESISTEALPAAFVVPMSEEPDDPATTSRYRQTVRFNFAVLLMVPNTEDEQGLTAWEKADDLKKEVFHAILGADDIKSGKDWIQFEGLSIADMNRAALTIQLDFSCEYEITDDETRHGADIDRLGRFLRMYTDVDVIGDKGRPDGQIEAKMHINLEQEK